LTQQSISNLLHEYLILLAPLRHGRVYNPKPGAPQKVREDLTLFRWRNGMNANLL